MEISDLMISHMKQWATDKLTVTGYYFQDRWDGRLNSEWVIYGTGPAQVTYLAAAEFIRDLTSQGAFDFFARLPDHAIKTCITEKRSEIEDSKTTYQFVSNYWLKHIAQYDQIFLAQQKLKENSDATHNELKKLTKKITRKQNAINDVSQASDFLLRLQQSSYSLEGALDDWRIQRHTKWTKSGRINTYGNEVDEEGRLADLSIRRACKFLLYDSISQGKHVAYLLDDLNLKIVSFLTSDVTGIPDWGRFGERKKVPVCTTEIRELFRYWDLFRNKVTFYLEFWSVKPPWEAPTATVDQLRNWAAYASHLASKEAKSRSTNTDLLDQCITQYLEKNYKQAIDLYHRSRPSAYGHPSSMTFCTTAVSETN